jgi:hypothetical protein
MAESEGSMESTSTVAPARRGGVQWRGRPVPSVARCRGQRERDAEAEVATIVREAR